MLFKNENRQISKLVWSISANFYYMLHALKPNLPPPPINLSIFKNEILRFHSYLLALIRGPVEIRPYMRLGSCAMSANVTIMQMLSLTSCRTRENQVENVGLHGRRPNIVGSGNEQTA